MSGYIPKDVFAFAAYSIDLYPKIVNGICDISNDSVAHSKSRGLTYTYFYKNPKTFQLESVDPSGLSFCWGNAYTISVAIDAYPVDGLKVLVIDLT